MSTVSPSVLDEFRRRYDQAFSSAPGPAKSEEWETPLPLDEPERPPFPTHVLPDVMRDMVEAVAEDTQTPADLAAIMALGTVSAAVGGKAEICVRKNWNEPVHTQSFCALGSGNRKTAVVRQLTKPLTDEERRRAADDRKRQVLWKSDRRIKEARLKKLEGQAVEPDKPGKERPRDLDLQIRALTEELATDREPAITQFIVDDVTPEKLGAMIYEQGGSLAAISAEGGFFGNMTGRYSEGPNLEPWLKGHSCDPMPVHRIGRESTYVPRPALTIAVTPQPIVIAELGKVKGVQEKGATARLLPSFPLSIVGRRRLSSQTASVPDVVASRWNDLVLHLQALEASGEIDDDGFRIPHVLSLSSEARAVHATFEAEIEPRLLPNGDLGHIEGWGSKVVGAAARIAGLLHLAEHAFDRNPFAAPVSPMTMRAALAIARYHIAHALIFFDTLGEQTEASKVREVLEAIRQLGDGCTMRDLFIKLRGRNDFKKVASLDGPLDTLEELGYIRIVTHKSEGGRPRSKTIDLNPLAQNTQKPQKSASVTVPEDIRLEAEEAAEELRASGPEAIEGWRLDLERRRADLSEVDYAAGLLAWELAQQKDVA